MAKSINQRTANIIFKILNNKDEINNLTAKQAVELAFRNFVIINDDALELTEKAKRALARFNRNKNIANAVVDVEIAIKDILKEPGATTRHRQVWEKVGRDKYERDTVLQALNILRDKNILDIHKTSNNNFQVFWRLAQDKPTTPTFEINNE